MKNSYCSYCDRKGILLYPVRYAVACPNGQSEVPGISGNFKIIGGPEDITPAKYTLRKLRTGYLYTYEEKQKRLKAYMVLSTGALWEFPVEYAPVFDPDSSIRCCMDRVKVALSYCIDVGPADCEILGNIWLGWSNVLWTKTTVANIQNAGWRKKHMQCIDGQMMLAGKAPHSAKFQENYSVIPHFTCDNSAQKKAFAYSNSSPDREASLHDRGQNLKNVLQEQCPYGGFIIALNDPVGITNDLSELTSPTHHAGFDEEMYRGQICTQLIYSLENTVREDARISTEGEILLERAGELSPEVAHGGAMSKMWKMMRAGGISKYAEQQKAERKKYGNSKEGRILAAQEEAWKDILTHPEGGSLLDDALIKSFPERYHNAVKKYEPIGSRISNLHCSWLTSTQLSEWMAGTHDETDLRSGYAFRESLSQCIGKAVSVERCQSILENWMASGSLVDTRNLYGRALLYNQKEILAAAEMEIRGSDFKPKYLLSIYKGVLGRVAADEAARLVDSLALTTAKILARALGQGSNFIMRNLAIAGLTLQARTFIKPSNLSKSDLSKWIIKSAESQGVKFLENRRGVRSSARKEAKRALPKYPASPTICAFELDIEMLESDGRIQSGSLKPIGIPGHELLKKWFGANSDFNTGVVGVILQLGALFFTNEDLKRIDELDRTKQSLKVAVASVALSSALLETVAGTLQKFPEHPLSKAIFAHWAITEGAAKKAVKCAKIFGALAGVANAAFDIMNAADAYNEGDWVLGSIYAASGVLSAALAVAGYFLASAIFWPLFALTLILGLLVGVFRPAPVKKWIGRCYFSSQRSSGEHKRYSSLDEELIAYNGALAG
ncbi:T6SS effector BTH_I2691 family protein [Pseudoduganella lutea]|uniref:Toxin VasX N-terminal region domain-containing protein n=1 Tax=Pseudoduganella lutea TaxID=321985 RepID=A0A4P6KW91_9BURK|nr:T6SS effector BTH_I2691 family protein [Pseudoduganella lutea]QBE62732.1 hypothetical protein EWM63_06905 [Pseudoduganella lutea]